MLKIGDKVFLNIQEAVGWLMANNCLPFQSTANYAADAEIGLSTLVNPSPAKLRIGSIIFFADAKAATVTGITSTAFTVGDDYIDMDQNPHVTNVVVDASGHLITTLSDGTSVDAGLIKQVSGFSISASQHLVAAFNDGTTQDLGAIFAGDVNISGTLRATKVEQSQPSVSIDFTLVPDNAAFSIDHNQSKLEVINGVLYLELNVVFINKTAVSETISSFGASISLPHSIATLIRDVKENVLSVGGTDELVAAFPAACQDYDTERSMFYWYWDCSLVHPTTPDAIDLYGEGVGINVNPGDVAIARGSLSFPLI